MLNFESVKDIMNSLNNMKTKIDSIGKNYSKLIKLGNPIYQKEEEKEEKTTAKKIMYQSTFNQK